MRLVFCVGKLDRAGGTEKVLANKANYFVEELGYEVHIITVDQPNNTLFYSYSSKIIFHNIKYKSQGSTLFNPFRFIRNIKYFKKKYQFLFDKINPDIITVNERGYLDYVIPFVSKNIPKVREFHSSRKAISIHASQMRFTKRIKHLLMYKSIYFMFNKYNNLVLLTNNDKNDSNYKTNVTVIPNTHKPVVNRKSKLDKKKVISVGSMNGEIKRFALQIDLWREIVKEFPNWTLNIYGDGTKKNILQHKINKLGLTKKVILHGTSNQLHNQYVDSSIYLFTSIGEGFGMVLIEAMSYGVPCISFDCPHGPSEIITDNKDGFLVENNNIKELKEKLILLMKDENLRQNMGAKAFENSKRFLPSEIAKQWDNLYNKII